MVAGLLKLGLKVERLMAIYKFVTHIVAHAAARCVSQVQYPLAAQPSSALPIESAMETETENETRLAVAMEMDREVRSMAIETSSAENETRRMRRKRVVEERVCTHG